MPESAYIVGCVRSAGGKRNGKLSGWHPIELGAAVLDALVEQTGIKDCSMIDDVIFGCLSTVGSQAGNIGRNCVLASKKIPDSVPGVTLDRQCGSSQQAIHFAAQAVMSGNQDVVIAGGVESMSVCAIGASVIDGMKCGRGIPICDTIVEKYAEKLKSFEEYGVDPSMFSQFAGAELVAKKYGLTRQELDRFAAVSNQRAVAATKFGKFKREIVPLQMKVNDKYKGKAPASGEMHTVDEGIRDGVTAETLAKLAALHPNAKDSRVTAASASQICDGAAAVLICNDAGLKKLGLKPRARIIEMAVCGCDPVLMLEGPIPATQKALQKAKMSIEQFDRYEVNEAFASVPLAWKVALQADEGKLNVNGGAMALGHPIGATGAKLMTTLVHALEACGGKYGCLAICEGGGTGNCTLIEKMCGQSKL